MAKEKYTEPPWGQIRLQGPVDDMKKVYDEAENVAMRLQLLLKTEPRLEEVLDLFPETLRRLQHIREDLEDIQAGKPFRHEGVFRHILGSVPH